jgi:hypothetical protein
MVCRVEEYAIDTVYGMETPLSPMLFLLAMKPCIYMLFRYAQNSGELGFLRENSARFKMSLYANDAAIFINPTPQDLSFVRDN